MAIGWVYLVMPDITKVGEFHMRIMRLKEVIEKTGLAKTTIYNLISQGEFPKQIDLGARSVGWVDTEIEEWIKAKIELRDKENNS